MDESPSFQSAADVVHQFELDLIDDKIVGFVIAAVGPDDSVLTYSGATTPVSRVRLIGAMHYALHAFGPGKESSNE